MSRGGLLRRFPVLAIRDFRLLLADRLIAPASVGFSLVGVSFAVLKLTNSPTDLSYVLAAQIAPSLIFALLGGVAADRFPPQRVIIAANLMMALGEGTFGIGVLAGHPSLWAMMGLEAVTGTGIAIFYPASQALLPRLVPGGMLQEASAISRSARSSRKSRIASTGNRRRSPPRDIGSVLSRWRMAGLASTRLCDASRQARPGATCFPSLRGLAKGQSPGAAESAELIDPGPHARRIVLAGQPQHRLPALVLGLEAGIAGKAILPVGPDHLEIRWPDVAVIPVRDREHAGHPPARVHGAEGERARADAVELIAGFDRRAVRDAISDRVQDDRHVLEGQAVHSQLRTLVSEPQADRVRPGRRDLIAKDGGDRPADGTNVVGDGLHAGLRIDGGALIQRRTLRASAPFW